MTATAAPEPLVSVIIPVYNAAKYLRETLDCVCNQTLREIEIICVDDGSTDDSPAILQEYAARDGRFRILQQKNQYAGVARNNGMAAARGKYLSFLDADDLFEPEMLEKMSARAEETESEMVLCKADSFEDDSVTRSSALWIVDEGIAAKLPMGPFVPSRDIPKDIFQLSVGVPWNKLFLKSFIEAKNLQWASTQNANDFGFVFHATALAARVIVIDNIYVHYRIRHDSIAHSKKKALDAPYIALKDLWNRLKGIPCSDSVSQSFDNVLLNQLAWHIAYAAPELRQPRMELYMKSYEPYFHFLQRPESIFNDREAYKNIMSMLAPKMSIVVKERNPARLVKCLASFSGYNLGGNEIICSRPIGIEAIEDKMGKVLQSVPGIRMLEQPVDELKNHVRTKKVAIVEEGWMLEPGIGDVYGKLQPVGEGFINVKPFLTKIKWSEKFIRYTPNEKSYRMFGKGIFTIRYSKKTVTYWLLGRKVWTSKQG